MNYIRETEEGTEISLFLIYLKETYKINEVVGTYICSKLKNFINSYRHKTKRAIQEELKKYQIVSSKVNRIIDNELKESNLEKAFEYFSFPEESNLERISKNITCRIKQLDIKAHKISNIDDVLPIKSCNIEELADDDINDTKSTKVKKVCVEDDGKMHNISLPHFGTISVLKSTLVKLLGFPDDKLAEGIIKYFDSAINEWKIIQKWSDFNENDRLQIFYQNNDKNLGKTKISQAIGDISCHMKVDDPSIDQQMSSIYKSTENFLEDVVDEYVSSGGNEQWVEHFQLPLFNATLTKKMEEGQVISAKERMQICQDIYDHVSKNSSIEISSLEIKVILKFLFLIYPKVAELEKDHWVTWNVWKVSVEKTFNKKKMQSNGRVSAPCKRKSQTSKSKVKKRSKSNKGLKKKKEEEEEADDESNMKIIYDEFVSKSPDMKRVSAAMNATFHGRRNSILAEDTSIDAILISYPWLQNESQIFAEFCRITCLDVQIDTAIESGFRRIAPALIHLLRTQQKNAAFIEKEKYLKKSKLSGSELDFRLTLFSLPLAFGEDIENIFKPMGSYYEESIQIEYDDESNAYDEAKCYSVIIEDGKIECSSLKTAVAVYFSSFFIFNLEYPSDMKKFLCSLEKNLLKIPSRTQPPPGVVKVFSKIDDYLASKSKVV